MGAYPWCDANRSRDAKVHAESEFTSKRAKYIRTRIAADNAAGRYYLTHLEPFL